VAEGRVAQRTQGVPPAGLPADWPWRERSEVVHAAGLRWHVQRWLPPQPEAGWIVLLHGSGASTHSFAGLAPLLAAQHGVLLFDLPGHAFTQRPPGDGLSLPGMARAVGALLRHEGIRPAALVGHSAGAAVAARLCLDGAAKPAALISLNGAWLPPAGSGRWWYTPAAKLLAFNPLAPWLFSRHAARPATLARLIEGTGSRLDVAGRTAYARLAGDVGHVGAVLAMMAAWDLAPLWRELPRLQPPSQPRLHLVAALRDAAVPPAQADAVAARVPGARLHRLEGLGHLAHEEDPVRVGRLVLQCLAA
jgi:magnesium chelatase accessory protein